MPNITPTCCRNYDKLNVKESKYGVRLLNDKAQVHTATISKTAMWECKFSKLNCRP